METVLDAVLEACARQVKDYERCTEQHPQTFKYRCRRLEQEVAECARAA